MRCRLEADTAGHRFWRCPSTAHLRHRMLPTGFREDALPAICTRFGVATSDVDPNLMHTVQRYMIAAVRATSVVRAATAPLETPI